MQNAEGKTAYDLAVQYRYPQEYLSLLDPTPSAATRQHFVILSGPEYNDFALNALIPITVDGCTWKSVEHYFQAQKFDEAEERERIRSARTVAEAIRLGRRAGRVSWPKKSRDQVMYEALLVKFSQHVDLHKKLLETGDAILVDDVDGSYWIDGFEHNMLGRFLIKVRAELRSQKEA